MKKIIIIVLAFFVTAFIATAYFTNQAQWVGIRQTDDHDEADAVIITDNYPQYDIEPNFGVLVKEYDLLPTDFRVRSFAIYNDKLYAGTGLRGYIFKYDRIAWSFDYNIPETNPAIWSLAVYKEKLYAGTSGTIYEYDGTSWSLNYSAKGSWILSLAVYNDKLYAGGIGSIYEFDGTTWSVSYTLPLVSGASQQVWSLIVYKNKLYAGTSDYAKIYEYDGTTWSENYDAGGQFIHSFAVYNDKLYAGQGNEGRVYEYDGTSWSISSRTSFVSGPGIHHNVRSLASYNNKLYAGVTTTETFPERVELYEYDGTAWQSIADIHDRRKTIYSMKEYNGKLYLGTGYRYGTVYSYHILPRQEVTIENTDPISVNITEAVALKTNATIKNIPLPVNITNYGMKEYTATIIGNGTNTSPSFNNKLKHLIIEPTILPASLVSQLDGTDGIDTFVYENLGDTNYGTDPVVIFGGGLYGVDATTRTLFNWNFTCQSISRSIDYNTVQLDIYVYEGYFDTSTLNIYPMNDSWEETFVTWNNCGDGGCNAAYNSSWNIKVANTPIPGGAGGSGWVYITLNKTWYQKACDGDIDDYGFILIGNEAPINYKRIRSSDYATAAQRPILRVNSTITPLNWRFKLTDSDGYIIYDKTDADQTGGFDEIIDLPLTRAINITIQNVTHNSEFAVSMRYT